MGIKEKIKFSFKSRKKKILLLILILVNLFHNFLIGLSLISGYLTARLTSGRKEGKPGFLRSWSLKFREWRIHLHHWLLAFSFLTFAFLTDLSIVHSPLFQGFTLGLILQGIFDYEDWYKIIKK